MNVDAELCTQTVPAVYPTTYDEDARYLAAHRRRRDHLDWKRSRQGPVLDERAGT